MKPLFTELPTLPLAQEEAARSTLSLLGEFLATGGGVMFLIVLSSMVSVTVMISVWLRLRDRYVLPPGVIAHLRRLPDFADKGDIRPLQEILEKDNSLLSRLGAKAISGTFASREECVETITARAKEELHHLERGVSVLEAMVTLAPLLGLMGTTVGLVGMFTAFGDERGPDTVEVAREIGVALRCTIAGLFVAVPSVVAHTYFVRRLDSIAVRMESILHETVQTFFAHFEVRRGNSK